ncbi:Helicase conserved C-terminal domain-containing protein [Oribacterium sp. KHPX15]|uniref:helicase-related protein n=1 Tax=Oribacterium sp. KHPX15 TaxID=1855342 RepID=UPI0008959BBD|nr:helicase-related protein [Oribacterium sp. KHPX15]SEA76661.1 Helicase conserved C-terminal domain-containing protein [Oribacterium sp. KHPX15]
MIEKSKLIAAREEYIELVKKELLGPGSEISLPDEEHELISDSPNTRYSIGILYTKENKMNADNNDSSRIEERDDNADEIENTEIEVNNSENFVSHKESVSPSDEENLDEEVGLATQNMPSSMGITFFAKGHVDKINCIVKFATYKKALSSDCRIPINFEGIETYELPDLFKSSVYIDTDEKTLRLTTGGMTRKKVRELEERDLLGGDEHGIISCMYKLADQLSKGYVRVPHEIEVQLEYGDKEYIDQNKDLADTKLKITSLRRQVSEDVYSYTIMLVNDDIRRAKPDLCIYQPSIAVSTDNNAFIFVEYNGYQDFETLDDEEKSLLMQYRNKRVYGTGLGTSMAWKIDEEGKGWISNDFFPQVEVPSMDFKLVSKIQVPDEAFSMKYLSDLNTVDQEEKLAAEEKIIDAYEEWISELYEKTKGLDPKYKAVALKNIEGCRSSAKRMRKGIDILRNNKKSWQAFQLANRAMFMQRAHLKLQSVTSNINRYPDDEELSALLDEIDYTKVDEKFEDKYSWRPFQIAFLLMSIESIVNDSCDDRDLVDLIWFPTGGGKTEAYLGLTAFTIFYRRLSNLEVSSGTTVIMRYTLRLLAAQQFTRASTLICACEYIRVDATSRKPQYGRYPLGEDRITIGLWIGGDHTPNKDDQAKSNLNELLKASTEELEHKKDRFNKFQVLKCPWCGTKLVQDIVNHKKIGVFGYRMKNNRHLELYCPQESCFFNSAGSLPIQVVDEELYNNPPTLLFGTVDKFAMLPWNPRIGSFFGIGSYNRSPELIIQDELHLISGPLGTMVGLYEAAIDALCKSKGVSTKIIASTATIRRAVEQCASLYDRNINQFPHPGIDAEDSFFARESIVNYSKDIFGRKYVGLMPSGKTKAMMEIRAISAMLQKINSMNLSDEVKDKYWTLTVYFNSLKDLGKCSTLVDDDIKDFIKRMAYRIGTAKDARMITSADELTSRVSTTQLNQTLDKLEKLAYSKENIENKRWPSNVLLATNMISVGIDVARLNVMLLVGQPKLTSEYIQASSRVGREFPGVAFTMYDGSKSRDRSHYEQFKSYHESFYKHVEPTGVTPFSKPARERALHAVVISLLRQLNIELSDEKGVSEFSREKYSKEISDVTEYIVSRSNSITNRINPDMATEDNDIREEISLLLEQWESMMNGYDSDHFYYGEKYLVMPPDKEDGRLMKVYNTNRFDPAFDTMTSMRNVDISSGSSVVIWEED